MHRKSLGLILSLCLSLLCSCGNGTEQTAAVAETPAVTETTSVCETAAEAPEVTEETTERTVAVGAEITETEKAVETEILQATETVTEKTAAEIIETTEKTETATETEAAETTAETAETTTAATEAVTAETTTQTEKKPAAEVVIPEIRIPLASGENVASGGTAEIDYSCADDGYISAVYTGRSKRAKLRVKCGDVQYDHDLAADGSREFFPLMTSGRYSVKVYELVSGKSYAEAASAEFDVNISSSTEMYLYPNKYIDFHSGSAVVKKAAELCAGADDEVEKIAAIFGYAAENISYDKKLAATVQSGYIPDPDSTLAAGKGICFDYASLVAAMCRSQGIPARLVIGYAEPDIYHAWNEIYTAETGWITPELFLKKKGFNITDATFYAGNSDKEKIAAYISDESNYTAMYRY